MLFWCIIIAISICVAGFLTATLSIPTPEVRETEQEMTFYKAQLEEIERDTARGLISDREAEHLGFEINRRILNLDKYVARDRSFDKKPRTFLGGIIIAFFLIGGSLSLYQVLGAPGYRDFSQADRITLAEQLRLNRPSFEDWIKQNPHKEKLPTNSTDLSLLKQLRKTVSDRPDDLQGHILLVQIES